MRRQMYLSVIEKAFAEKSMVRRIGSVWSAPADRTAGADGALQRSSGAISTARPRSGVRGRAITFARLNGRDADPDLALRALRCRIASRSFAHPAGRYGPQPAVDRHGRLFCWLIHPFRLRPRLRKRRMEQVGCGQAGPRIPVPCVLRFTASARHTEIGNRPGSIPFEARSSLLPTDVSRRTIYNRCHTLLRSLLELIPTLPATLWPLLEARFPSKRDNRESHVCYISNLLRVMFYCPALEENILELVVGRAIKLDVEIQVEVEDWEDEDGHLELEIFGKSVDDAFDKTWTEEEASDDEGELLDDGLNFDDLSSDEGVLSDDEEDKADQGPDEAAIRKVKELAAKLDAVLRCVFDHLQQMHSSRSPPTFSSPPPVGQPSPGLGSASYASSFSAMSPVLFDSSTDEGHADRKRLFNILLILFERHILCTHRTRHTQFILFWYASLDPQFTDDFLGLLVEASLFDDGLPVVTRVAATGYVASLVGRARYIERDSARHVMKLLCARLDADLDRFGTASVVDSNGNETTGQQYASWYAIAQAAFYIFCFRWKDLMEQEEEDEEDPVLAIGAGRWMPSLKVLERAVSSHLNPLKVRRRCEFGLCVIIVDSPSAPGLRTHSRRPVRPDLPASRLPVLLRNHPLERPPRHLRLGLRPLIERSLAPRHACIRPRGEPDLSGRHGQGVRAAPYREPTRPASSRRRQDGLVLPLRPLQAASHRALPQLHLSRVGRRAARRGSRGRRRR